MKEIKITSLDHIQICIPSGEEDKARSFYTDILGLKEIPKPAELIPNGGLWYEIAGIQLHIGTEDVKIKSKSHPAFEIENLEEARKYLEDNKVIIKEEIRIPGVNRFSFYDPFGNRVEFLERKR
ncbi:MAG: VOC family protein [Ignavibacteria bacterium]|nr:VOC family protein [Ignavibacteria bacterium]